jgi:hypothetical protein
MLGSKQLVRRRSSTLFKEKGACRHGEKYEVAETSPLRDSKGDEDGTRSRGPIPKKWRFRDDSARMSRHGRTSTGPEDGNGRAAFSLDEDRRGLRMASRSLSGRLCTQVLGNHTGS